jgi:DNA adenine methylase
MERTTGQEESRHPISPLIKWPGGKRALAPAILDFFPDSFGTYYEPFFGGGAVFFALQPEIAVLSDANAELINAYTHVRDYPTELAKALRSLKNTEDDYYEVRSSSPRTPLRRAARTLYLTRLAFNGIHRVNLRGEFNVPYGQKTHLETVDLEHLRQASTALQGAELRVGDFESITEGAQAGDVLYFDPPYTVAHANNGFVKYNERIFSWQDQERLAAHALTLAGRGCRVIISNADHPSLRKLYREFDCYTIERHSVIAASSEHRRQITECIFVLGGE